MAKIGACWLKVSKDGKTKYMSCNIELDGKKYYFSMFKNNMKEKENQPDYNILSNDRGPDE